MKNLDWGKLSFGYSKTDYNVRCYYKDGKWSAPEVSDSEMLNIHMASTWFALRTGSIRRYESLPG